MRLIKTISKHYRKDLNQIEYCKSLLGIKYYLYTNKKGFGRHKLFFKKRKRNFSGLEMLWATNRLNYLIDQDPFMNEKTIDYHFNKLIKDANEQHLKNDSLKDSNFISKNPFSVFYINKEEKENKELYPNNAKILRFKNCYGWELI